MYGNSHRVVRRVPPPRRQRKKLLTIRRILLIGVVGYLIVALHPRLPSLLGTADAGPKITKTQTICLDPGHGGTDAGAQNGRFSERNLNLTVAKETAELLGEQGYRVYMTRTANSAYLYNHGRYKFCNNKHATILVSIHQNYFDDPTVDYTEALYFKPTDQALAQSLTNAVSAKLGTQNNNISSFEDGVLSKSTMPAALIEGFFITDSSEYAKLSAPGSLRLRAEAEGIAQGIETYFTAPAKPNPQGEDTRLGD
jgi:N-acetylmuramoyl-L-alanine amidase